MSDGVTLKCNFLEQSMKFLSVLEETSSNPAQGKACGSQSSSSLPGVSANTSTGKMITNPKVIFKISVKAVI